MKIRDRIKELRRVKASELRPSPRNWRTHPDSQRDALRGVLAEVGYADALIAREVNGSDLELIDGHLRAETTPDMEVPVLVLDVTEEEANLILATLDPLAGMAEAEAEQLERLLGEVTITNQVLENLLAAQANVEPFDPENEWDGMPDFEQDDASPVRTIHVHFETAEAVNDFARRLEQEVTEKTKFIYHPKVERENLKNNVCTTVA